MTPLQLIVATVLYLIEFVVVVYFTRATSRRLAGAFVGGAATAHQAAEPHLSHPPHGWATASSSNLDLSALRWILGDEWDMLDT
jgi:hypothetical protein